MMKKLIMLLFVSILSFVLVGCNKDSAYDMPMKPRFEKGFTVNCKMTGYANDNKITAKYESKIEFNRFGLLSRIESTVVEKAKNGKVYKDRVNLYKAETIVTDEGDTYEISYNDKKRTITIHAIFLYDMLSFSINQREQLFVTDFISNVELAGYTCEFDGINREEVM